MPRFTVWAPAPSSAGIKAPSSTGIKPNATHWAAAGELEFQPGGCTFRYHQSWLQAEWAYSLDPVHLPLAPAIYYPKAPSPLLPLFAQLIPTGWAAQLLKNKLSTAPAQTPYAQFKLLPGGLNPIRLSSGQQPLDELRLPAWEELEQVCEKAREQQGYDYPLGRFVEFMAGGCWQGERPKLTVQGSDKLWLAKWQLKHESINWPQLEYACLELLHQAGLNVPPRHLIPTDGCGWLYLIERFDQLANNPVYFVGADVLLGHPCASAQELDARRDPGSYIALARCVRKYSSQAKADLHELFRRLLANLILNNTQDYLHKFGLVYQLNTGQWRLAPCFGLRPSALPARHHAMAIGTQGRLRSLTNALSLAAEFALTAGQAQLILAQLQEECAQWQGVFDSCGVSGRDRQWLSGVIQLEGLC